MTEPSASSKDGSNCSSNPPLLHRVEQFAKSFKVSNQYRQDVREEIAKAYTLHKAVETLKDMLQEERVTSNPLLEQALQKQHQDMVAQRDSILQVPTELLTVWERYLRDVVHYQMEHHTPDLSRIPSNHQLSAWLERHRLEIANHLEAKDKPACREDDFRRKEREQKLDSNRKIFQQLHIKLSRAHRKTNFDEYMELLRDYKKEHGNIKVARIYVTPQGGKLGEWLHKLRRQYDDFEKGQPVPTLTKERVAELNDLGMIWRIRHGRPRKGDARYRLNYKGKKDTNNDNQSTAVVERGEGEPGVATADK